MGERLRVARARVRRRMARLVMACARPAGLLLRAAPSLIGLLLLSFGVGLVYRPAGFIAAGVLILADVVAGRMADDRRSKVGGG